MTDIIASANLGDVRCIAILQDVERYISQNPTLIVIDPIPNVRKIIDRYSCYSIIHSTNLCTYEVFTPNFCTLETNDVETIKHQLRIAHVTYPFLCKPLLGHGSRKAHQICIIFNERSLIDISTPCVAQSFINHDASLFKIYVAGDKHCMVERPSLKNYQASDRETIYFDSSDVSKAGSKSRLSVLDPEDVVERREPDEKIINLIATTLRKAFGMDLFGVDVVIEKSTGKYAIIDVNAYPGYDGFPNFYEALLECISKKMSTDLT
ncbi:inositol-tetrakisphosphate 1-kinase isoform X2 [Leptinotarsa decemlineata]|nr:inositol-tetrakisphosphate 1-kinase-like isoform X2 [Leptinotarsa decemlineata]